MSYLLPLKIKTISVVKERTTEPSGVGDPSVLSISPLVKMMTFLAIGNKKAVLCFASI